MKKLPFVILRLNAEYYALMEGHEPPELELRKEWVPTPTNPLRYVSDIDPATISAMELPSMKDGTYFEVSVTVEE